jgi:hypothetical protein
MMVTAEAAMHSQSSHDVRAGPAAGEIRDDAGGIYGAAGFSRLTRLG